MNLHWLDWAIIAFLLATVTIITLVSSRAMRGVADFLAANRMAGRYLLTVAQGIGGAVSIIATWEMLYAAGLPTQWWSMIGIPLGLILSLSGFVIYRFRQTRALTLAQFFEMRYSRRFRFFAGLLCWTSGLFNYGIFPMVTARFMIHFFGLPESWMLGGWEIPTYPTVMAAYLGFALFIALSGGQIAIMITDFYQGVLTLLIFVILMVFIVHRFSWDQIIAGLQLAPEGQSMINPFATRQAEDFNIWYFLIALFSGVYTYRAWQGSSGYNAAAKTPHDAQMAGILGQWRNFAQGLCMLLIPLAAYAVLHHPQFSQLAEPITRDINALADPQVRKQMTVPLFLTHILPVGLIGLFAAIIVAAAIACDNTYLHAWGTIFIQDVVLPWRNKPFTPRTHLLLLRLSIAGVAVFGFTWSLLFPLKQYILMYFALTSAIYMGGAGAVIIGGLYWKRGTTAAAWTALIVGGTLAFGGLATHSFWTSHLVPLLKSWWPHSGFLVRHGEKFPLNGQVMYFYAMLVASLSYVAVSLLGPRREFDMDKLLHRGRYAVETDAAPVAATGRRSWASIIGMSPNFSRFERTVFLATFWWSMGWWGIFLVGTTLALTVGLDERFWSGLWFFKVWLSFVIGIIMTVWLVCGGIRDALRLFRDLRSLGRDASDDGSVSERKDRETAAGPAR